MGADGRRKADRATALVVGIDARRSEGNSICRNTVVDMMAEWCDEMVAPLGAPPLMAYRQKSRGSPTKKWSVHLPECLRK